MKTSFRLLVLVFALAFTVWQCGPDGGDYVADPVDLTPTGTIDGEFTLGPQDPGSVANIEVSLYTSEDAFRNRIPARTMRTGVSGRYVFTGLCCGNYYIDAWKDNDGDSRISCGDHYLARRDGSGMACPCVVEQGVPASFCGVLEVVQ